MTLLHPLLRKLTCRVLSKGIGRVYKQTFGNACPARISQVRSLHCLCKVLPERTSNQKLTADFLCRNFGTALALDSFLLEAEASSLDLDVIGSRTDLRRFRQICFQIVQYRVNSSSAIPIQLRQVTSWNLNSLQAPCSTQGYKCAILSRYLKRGPVCIQETKWSDSDIVSFSTKWPGVIVVATPAAGIRNHAKGGTAILLPPGYALVEQKTLVPASVNAAKVRLGDLQIWIISIYFRPEATRVEFEYLLAQLKLLTNDPVFLCGDFNRADVKFPDLWSRLIENHSLHDVAPALLTYFHPGGASALDRFLIQDAAITENQLDCKVSAHEFFVNQGHCAISLHLAHRPKLQRDPRSVKHEVIPTQAFLLPQAATSDSQRHQHSKHLLFLHRVLSQQCHDPASINPTRDVNGSEGRTLAPSAEIINVRQANTVSDLNAGRGTLVPLPSSLPISTVTSPGQISFKATLWSWWKTVRSNLPGTSPFKCLYRKLRGQQSAIRLSPKLLQSLQTACGLEEISPHFLPRHNGCYLVPSKLVHQALQQIELLKSATAAYSAPKPTPSPVLQAIAQRQLWDRRVLLYGHHLKFKGEALPHCCRLRRCHVRHA